MGRQHLAPKGVEGKAGKAKDSAKGGGVVCHWQREMLHQRLGRAVAMAMGQPKKGLESKLLDKMLLKSAHYQTVKT